MCEVLRSLVERLDDERPGWRHTHVFIHDNCPAFATEEVNKLLAHLNVPCLMTAPASFQGLVVEGCFQVLKGTILSNCAEKYLSSDEIDELSKFSKKRKLIELTSLFLKNMKAKTIDSIHKRRAAHLR